MQTLGFAISLCSFLSACALIVRGTAKKSLLCFPLFYSYITYAVLATLSLYLVHWLRPGWYIKAYWFNYLINALAEFAVLVEISDHIFRPLVLLRNLGRALTLVISIGLGLLYILPTILGSTGRSRALASFALRTSVTKAVILAVLFFAARHYGSRLGRNVGGLMLGFSIYVALNVAFFAGAAMYSSAVFAQIYWFMAPLASALCVLVWAVSLWDASPVWNMRPVPASAGGNFEAVSLELSRYNRELSKLMQK